MVALKGRNNQTTNDLGNYTHLEMSDHGSLERSDFKQKKARLSEHSAEGSEGSLGRGRE